VHYCVVHTLRVDVAENACNREATKKSLVVASDCTCTTFRVEEATSFTARNVRIPSQVVVHTTAELWPVPRLGGKGTL
jgi:hypothetical protein